MADLRFYHLERTSLEAALPRLLERCLARGQRAVVVTATPERLEALDTHLWAYDPAGFIPHGTAADGFSADQPVWLTAAIENPNRAEVLFLCDGAGEDSLDASAFAIVALLFDGNDPALLTHARRCWKMWRDRGHTLTYWQEGETGWQQKATA